MKKPSIILSIVMTICVLCATIPHAFANEISGLYIQSPVVDNRRNDFIETITNNVFSELYHMDDIGSINSNDIYMGQAFQLNEITYSPIVNDNKNIALLAVFSVDSGLSWSLSKDFSDGLNAIARQTSQQSPALLFTKKGNVYSKIGLQIQKITNNPENNLISEREYDSLVTYNILVPYINNPLSGKFNRSFRSALSVRKLNFDFAEVQGSQQWCAAFVTAQILRFKGKGDVRARQIMSYFYPYASNLESKSLTHGNVINYANTKGVYPYKTSRVLSYSEVINQVNASKPIYLSAKGSGGYDGRSHALALGGYSDYMYFVWNPWNPWYISMPIGSQTIAVSGGAFTWKETILDW